MRFSKTKTAWNQLCFSHFILLEQFCDIVMKNKSTGNMKRRNFLGVKYSFANCVLKSYLTAHPENSSVIHAIRKKLTLSSKIYLACHGRLAEQVSKVLLPTQNWRSRLQNLNIRFHHHFYSWGAVFVTNLGKTKNIRTNHTEEKLRLEMKKAVSIDSKWNRWATAIQHGKVAI